VAAIAAQFHNRCLQRAREFPRRTGTSVSPWNPEFVQFIVVSAAWAVGSYFFSKGDTLVAQRHFSADDRDAYSAAETLAVALVRLLSPPPATVTVSVTLAGQSAATLTVRVSSG